MTHHVLKLLGMSFFVLLALGSASNPPNSPQRAVVVNAPTYSAVELRQMQSRQFATTDLEKVRSVVDNAFKDMGFLGGIYGTSGSFHKRNMSASSFVGSLVYVDVSLYVIKQRGLTVLRVAAKEDVYRNGSSDSKVFSATEYQKIFAVISKSLFLEAQQLDAGVIE